jgi:hypothetical protein
MTTENCPSSQAEKRRNMKYLQKTTASAPATWASSVPPIAALGAGVINAAMLFTTVMSFVELGVSVSVGVASIAAATATRFKSKSNDRKREIALVNGLLRDNFRSEVVVGPDKNVRKGFTIDDGDGGSFAVKVVHDGQNTVDIDAKTREVVDLGTIEVVHTPGDLGLKEFDKLLVSMSTNPDVKAIAARIAYHPVRYQ